MNMFNILPIDISFKEQIVLSESGVTYVLSEIEIEPIARLRDEKLEKLGL